MWDSIAFGIFEGDVCGVRQSLHPIASDGSVWDALEDSVLQAVAQRLYPCGGVVQEFQSEFGCPAEPDYAWRVLSAGTPAVLLVSPLDQRAELHATPDPERADPFGAMKLVA
ncbi:hypothetical protein MPL1032_220039 [Mesorhizobium plurifarium]|uniref:Uncharacterized protein n=1 Tax=Mesorhizobium plurifarium TaxID=69974 RepID=A0A0K2VYV9_MESPL|nr:hypothetical protein MPL1032_220039 [Mesorhizobium plurifarium]